MLLCFLKTSLWTPSKAGPCSLPKLIFVFFFSSYVGIVPEGNLMTIFVYNWQCKFLLKFLFVTEKKSTFHRNDFVGPRSVTARIGFSVDSDLHEKLLRRIGSRWCKNHVELDLYVFVSVHFFFVFRSEWICCPFENTVFDITWWDCHIKSDLHAACRFNVLIQLYIYRIDYQAM